MVAGALLRRFAEALPGDLYGFVHFARIPVRPVSFGADEMVLVLDFATASGRAERRAKWPLQG